MAKPMDQQRNAATLDSIIERLDVVISLLLRSPIQMTDAPSGLQLDILKLCDYDHTTEEIREAVNKSSNHVVKELSLMRSKGMIRTVRRDGRQVHIRLN